MKNIFKRGSEVAGFRNEIAKAASLSKEDFFTWFNEAQDTNSAFIRGSWDFSFHILFPLANYLKNPENKKILDIGHGGGRMIAAAARFFYSAFGVDIHNQNALVKSELRERGVNNVKLFSTNGTTIPLPDLSLDVVYSFIVFQHLGKISFFQNYLAEIYRVLKPNGLAILYFGRKVTFSLNKTSPFWLWADCVIEELLLPKGYLEMQADVNQTNLLITRNFAKKYIKSLNFKLLKFVTSYKNAPDGYGHFGGQHGMLIQR